MCLCRPPGGADPFLGLNLPERWRGMDEGSRIPSLVPSVSLGWLQYQGEGVPSPQQALWWLQVDMKDKVTLELNTSPL